MKRYGLILLFFVSVLSVRAQVGMSEANMMYSEGRYSEAAVAYEELLAGGASAELYYNLGNAYFKSGELAKSILNYERSLRIRPYWKDARYNLQFAQSRIIDNIEDKDSFFISKWLKDMRDLLPKGVWTLLSIGMFLLMLVMLMVFVFSGKVVWRKSGFYVSLVGLLLSLLSFGCAWSLDMRDKERSEAIVMQGVVNVKASPDKGGTDLFVLHEGTKVHIRSVLSDWVEVTVGDNRGWIRENTIERI